MSPEENKTLVRRLIEEAWNREDLAIIDELLSPDYVLHIDAPGPPGRKGYKQAVTMHRTAFSDSQFTIEAMIAEGDKVVLRATLHGIHTGDFMGIGPTGKQVTYTASSIRRIEAGRIVEE